MFGFLVVVVGFVLTSTSTNFVVRALAASFASSVARPISDALDDVRTCVTTEKLRATLPTCRAEGPSGGGGRRE